VSGRLVEQTGDRPIVGAFVLLLGADSTEYERALTDGLGRFSMQAPAAGTYALKSAVIGFRSTITPTFEIVAGQDIEVDFAIPGIPITLPTLIVEDIRACGGIEGAGLEAATAWEEARKALDAVVWTERQGTLQHVLVKYERLLDPESLEIRDRRQRVIRDIYQGSPFLTGDPQSLAERGYVQETESSERLFVAPDANVLLSDDFAASHCFSLVVSQGDRGGYVGLAFEPDVTRDLPDIEGVLWLDATTAELRYLDFTYTRIPYELEMNSVGGRVEFERLPAGPWIVRRWWVRMPIIGQRSARFSDFVNENYLAALKEDGGYVRDIHTLDDEPVARRGVATLTGTVLNLRNARPVAGAQVVLVGTDYSTETDRRGDFRFGYLPEGTYRISYGNRTLDAIGYVPPLLEVELTIDDPQFVTMAIPSINRLWAHLCPRTDPYSGYGIVTGFVRDGSTGRGSPGTQVIVHQTAASDTTRAESAIGDSMTDWAGYFRVCNVPAEESIMVEARWAGPSSVVADTTSVRLISGDIIRVDFALPPVEERDGTEPRLF